MRIPTEYEIKNVTCKNLDLYLEIFMCPFTNKNVHIYSHAVFFIFVFDALSVLVQYSVCIKMAKC